MVLLEEGDYSSRDDFNGHAGRDAAQALSRQGATVAIGNAAIPIPIGRAVGGTTTINSGTCYRAPERVLRELARRRSASTSSRRTTMAPYYERVEAMLGVAPAAGQAPRRRRRA